MIVSASVAVCDHCMTSIARERRKLQTDNPEIYCALSGVAVSKAEAYMCTTRR